MASTEASNAGIEAEGAALAVRMHTRVAPATAERRLVRRRANSFPFKIFTLEHGSFTARVELLPMTSGAGNMLFVLASGPANLNIGVRGP